MIPRYLIIHHTGTSKENTTFESVNKYHTDKWNYISSLGFGIGYHYFIDKAGKVTQGRADNEMGAHCRADRMNYKSIGIGLAGNFSNELPNYPQKKALTELLRKLGVKYAIGSSFILPHRIVEGASTECYGKKLPDDWARNLFLFAPTEPIEQPDLSGIAGSLNNIIEELKKLVVIFKNKK